MSDQFHCSGCGKEIGPDQDIIILDSWRTGKRHKNMECIDHVKYFNMNGQIVLCSPECFKAALFNALASNKYTVNDPYVTASSSMPALGTIGTILNNFIPHKRIP